MLGTRWFLPSFMPSSYQPVKVSVTPSLVRSMLGPHPAPARRIPSKQTYPKPRRMRKADHRSEASCLDAVFRLLARETACPEFAEICGLAVEDQVAGRLSVDRVHDGRINAAGDDDQLSGGLHGEAAVGVEDGIDQRITDLCAVFEIEVRLTWRPNTLRPHWIVLNRLTCRHGTLTHRP